MTEFRNKPESRAEELIFEVFRGREQEADSQIARLHFENQLEHAPVRPRVRNSLKAALFLTALLLLGSWASGIEIQAMDDAQQITIAMPAEFSDGDYNYWTAVFANHAADLRQYGGHSLVVDTTNDTEDRHYLQLGILGINYSDANTWIREVMEQEPELSESAYSITQPMVPYSLTVRDMLAYKLGTTSSIEKNVVHAWYNIEENPSHVYLIANPKGKLRNAQRFLY